jgi:cell pole-organizing protein PopZ
MSDPQHEPTMEEILASIRKIISEDGSETPPAAAPDAPSAAPFSAPAPAEEPDVLELTQVVAAAAPEPVAPQPVPPPPAPEPVQHDDIVFETVAPTPAYQPAPAVDHGDIFSDHTRKAMDDAFAAIPDEEPEPAPAPRPAAPIAPVDGATVENVFERAVRESFEPVLNRYLSDNSAAVIDRMKPLIREWMDEHFPPLLEGAVRAEVERVVKARGTKR